MIEASRTLAPYLQRIVDDGLIAIIRGTFTTDRLVQIAEILESAGIHILEVTLNSKDALTHIGTLRRTLPDSMVVGAGTVRTSRMVELAADAGAQFALSPSLDPVAVASARQLGLAFIPGVLTPTEVDAAANLGCDVVKLFPANTVGTEHLKGLRAVFGEISFIPTGGMTAENVGEYRAAGAVAVGIGGALIASHASADDDLRARAAALRLAWDETL